ncbi:hypothetical protein E8E13_004833 [Curvularia kusanoi]|uniref:3'-phosphate/5'-hydroxy nucleic acid ligase n=1 Tax=Curvularia kusanoi TaxID=90978 RepID=A0A9P4TBM3_CURKU|nr:hypothetical protein E8E13_004833 [Curvularia kusanoi]
MATRVTIANNAKQSQRAPLLLPVTASADPSALNSMQALVFKTAQSKLKVKKPTRVFVKQTGLELTEETNWRNNIKNDVVLLVSAGEDYVGVKKEMVVHGDINSDSPVEILASSASVESLSVTQLTTTAHTLPGIVYAVGQPDLHPGNHWDSSLGTIGAGNHFAEIQVVEGIANDSDQAFREGDVVLLVHSGSRGYGGSVLKKYAVESHVSLEEGTLETAEYLQEHDRACRWARANRDLIALRFLACLEPGNEAWKLGLPDADNSTHIDFTDIERCKSALQTRRVVDIWHNNVERVRWPPAPPRSASDLNDAAGNLLLDDIERPQEHVYIHRKGAAPTYDPETHRPLTLLPLPGSRGTPTLILQPSFSAATSWGLKNALSLAHGAGRSMSRAKALSSLSQKYRGQNILEPRGEDDGTWVICDEKDLVFEEAPDAYKDVQAVGQDLVDAGVATIIGWCRARVSYKVRDESR